MATAICRISGIEVDVAGVTVSWTLLVHLLTENWTGSSTVTTSTVSSEQDLFSALRVAVASDVSTRATADLGTSVTVDPNDVWIVDGRGPRANQTATTNPGASDDATAGWSVGSTWVNTSTDESFVCVDSSDGAAVWTSTTMPNGTGVVYTWGGKNGSVGYYFRVDTEPTGGVQSARDQNVEYLMAVAGTITCLVWNARTADNTTVFKVWKNGVVVETVALTGASGTDGTLTTTVAVGDKIAIEYDAGAAPQETNVQLLVSP